MHTTFEIGHPFGLKLLLIILYFWLLLFLILIMTLVFIILMFVSVVFLVVFSAVIIIMSTGCLLTIFHGLSTANVFIIVDNNHLLRCVLVDSLRLVPY